MSLALQHSSLPLATVTSGSQAIANAPATVTWRLIPDSQSSGAPITNVTVIKLGDVIAYLHRYWRIGAAAGGLAALATFVTLGCSTKVYEAEASIEVRIQEVNPLDIEHHSGGLTEQSSVQIVNNHRTALQTRRFVDYLYKQAPADWMRGYLAGTDRIGTLSSILIALHLKDQPPVMPPEDRFALKLSQNARVEIVKDSHILRTIVKDYSAATAALLANLYGRSYVSYQEDEAARSATEAQERLTVKVREARQRLDNAEAGLADFSQRADLMKSGDSSDISTLLAQELGKARATVDVELLHAQERVRQLRTAQTSGDVAGIRGLGDDMQVIEIQKMLILARSRYDALLEFCAAKHPRLVQAKGEIERLQNETTARIGAIIAAAESEEQRLTSEKRSLTERLASARGDAFGQGANRSRQKQLADEVESLRSLHASLVKQSEVVRLAAELRGRATAEVIDNARPPEAPVWPKKSMALVASALSFSLLGLCLPLGIGLSRDHLLPLIQTAASPQEKPQAPAVATHAPVAPQRQQVPAPAQPPIALPSLVVRIRRLCSPEGPQQLSEMLHPSPLAGPAPLNEAVARLEERRARHRGTGVILLTSPANREGKSLVSAALAATFCQTGRSVLLMEAHPAAPAVHHWFPVPGAHASWTHHLETLRYGQSSLFLLRHDQLPNNEVASLVHGYQAWIERARAQGIDWVIMDAASLLPSCADVLALAPLATDVLVVHDITQTSPPKLKAALKLLQQMVAPDVLSGIVLNQQS